MAVITIFSQSIFAFTPKEDCVCGGAGGGRRVISVVTLHNAPLNITEAQSTRKGLILKVVLGKFILTVCIQIEAMFVR